MPPFLVGDMNEEGGGEGPGLGGPSPRGAVTGGVCSWGRWEDVEMNKYLYLQ